MSITDSKRRSHTKIMKITGMIFGGIIIAVIFAFIAGYIVQLLWNWLMPDLFGLGTITYLQAFGLVILAKIFFGGIGHDHNHDHHYKKDHWTWHTKKKYYNKDDAADNQSDYFNSYWEKEGKQAYEEYVKRMKNNENIKDGS